MKPLLSTVLWRYIWIPVFLISDLERTFVLAEIEICTDGGENVFQLTHENCPHGVLFMEPLTADCVAFGGEDINSIDEDICAKIPYSPERKVFQYIPDISKDELDSSESCKTLLSSRCTAPFHKIRKESFLHRVSEVDLSFLEESNNSNVDSIRAQTERLFQHMIGLGRTVVDESLRVVLLLKKTFELFKKFAPDSYVRHEFWEDVETAFLFLFNEADSTRVHDVTNEEYETIQNHLNYCWDQKNPFVYEGLKCATYGAIQRIRKSGQLFTEFDSTNRESFTKYDIAVEATWGAIDFVHGLCYGTFRDHINSHHMYQQAMERLFTREILFRWQNRFVFQGQQSIWSHFFSANVKNALTNMDICIQASYLSTPFLHRLERPIDGKGLKRKKRSLISEIHSLKSFDSIEGYCFQTLDEKEQVLSSGFCD